MAAERLYLEDARSRKKSKKESAMGGMVMGKRERIEIEGENKKGKEEGIIMEKVNLGRGRNGD